MECSGNSREAEVGTRTERARECGAGEEVWPITEGLVGHQKNSGFCSS